MLRNFHNPKCIYWWISDVHYPVSLPSIYPSISTIAAILVPYHVYTYIQNL
jgi:hypothetical protein